MKRHEALDWFGKAARMAKRPIDAYIAYLAGFAAIFGRDVGQAIQEFKRPPGWTASRATTSPGWDA